MRVRGDQKSSDRKIFDAPISMGGLGMWPDVVPTVATAVCGLGKPDGRSGTYENICWVPRLDRTGTR